MDKQKKFYIKRETDLELVTRSDGKHLFEVETIALIETRGTTCGDILRGTIYKTRAYKHDGVTYRTQADKENDGIITPEELNDDDILEITADTFQHYAERLEKILARVEIIGAELSDKYVDIADDIFLPKYKLSTDKDGQTIIERRAFPRWRGVVTFGQQSDIEQIEVYDMADALTLAESMRAAGDFLLDYNKRKNDK